MTANPVVPLLSVKVSGKRARVQSLYRFGAPLAFAKVKESYLYCIYPNMESSQPPRLLDQVRQSIRFKHYSLKIEKSYVYYIRDFILFHQKRHPKEMGASEIRAYLTHLAVDQNVAASTQNVALSALLFLYRQVLEIELPYIGDIERAKKPKRLPVVFTRSEVKAILAYLDGIYHLIVSLLYGSGLRLSEGLQLRVKDFDFEYGQLTVRDGKGAKDSDDYVAPVTGRAVAAAARKIPNAAPTRFVSRIWGSVSALCFRA